MRARHRKPPCTRTSGGGLTAVPVVPAGRAGRDGGRTECQPARPQGRETRPTAAARYRRPPSCWLLLGFAGLLRPTLQPRQLHHQLFGERADVAWDQCIFFFTFCSQEKNYINAT